MAKYITLNNLQRFWDGIKTKLAAKVDVVDGKGLSTNDLTDELKAMYDEAEKNVIVGVNVNGVEATVSESRTVDVIVPTNTSDLNNDSDFTTNVYVEQINQSLLSTIQATDSRFGDYYTISQTDEIVNELGERIVAAETGKITKLVVDSLPTDNILTDVIYLVPRSEAEEDNVYYEYMYINDSFELLGSTEVDLSGYVKSSDLVEITDEEIDAIFNEASTGEEE